MPMSSPDMHSYLNVRNFWEPVICHMQNREKGTYVNTYKEKVMNPQSWNMADWRIFFVIAGMWNFSIALPALLMPRFYIRLMYGFRTDNFYIIMLNTVFFIIVSLFGAGYFMVACDPAKNTSVTVLGIIGKILVGGLFYYIFF